MIIGLLLGGVLKGMELVENARITQTVKQLNDYDTAVTIFRSIYNNQLPGDVTSPATRLPNCTTAPCNNTTGVGNYRMDTPVKSENFWRHLSRAGLITGINEGGDQNTISPLNPFGGYNAINYSNIGKPAPEPYLNLMVVGDPKANASPTTRIGPVRAKALDTKMDNGMPTTGQIQTHHTSSAGPPVRSVCHHATTLEYLTDTTLLCNLAVYLPSLN